MVLSDSGSCIPSYSVMEADSGCGYLCVVTDEVDAALRRATSEAEECFGNNLIFPAAITIRFVSLVKNGTPWDIKLRDSWKKTIGTTFPGYDMTVSCNGE